MKPQATTPDHAPAAAARPRSGLVPARLSTRQFARMLDAGVFPEGGHVELLDGVIVTMTKNEPHNDCVGALADLLRPFLPPGFHLREEKPARSGRRWQPEPDLAVVRGARGDFRTTPPPLSRLDLAIEVADSSYPKDRGVKWRKYAACRIPAYWIVDLNRRRVECFAEPEGRGPGASYRLTTVHDEDARIPVVLDGRTLGEIAVAEFLP